MKKTVLILGANGFIGNSLVEHILRKTDWHITALDLQAHHLNDYLNNPRFYFKQGDMRAEKDWVEQQIQICDVILPLVAIATPATYVQDPLRIFELDFEANLAIVRLCVKYHKRVVFPSTSEVYGMCPDEAFDEETSVLVTGPIHKQRWIYACAKQMMDRIIYAYGEKEALSYTLFRPFNWIGAKLDNVLNPQPGGSRVITQFVGNIMRGESIVLVNGGEQRRSFIDIDDGIGALVNIIDNKNQCADQKIFNIGYPENEYSIRQLAEMLIDLLKNYPKHATQAAKTKLVVENGEAYFGKGYQDVARRVPTIHRAKKDLQWAPKIDLKTSLKKILDYHLL